MGIHTRAPEDLLEDLLIDLEDDLEEIEFDDELLELDDLELDELELNNALDLDRVSLLSLDLPL